MSAAGSGQPGLWQPAASDREKDLLMAVVKHLQGKPQVSSSCFLFRTRSTRPTFAAVLAGAFSCGEYIIHCVLLPPLFTISWGLPRGFHRCFGLLRRRQGVQPVSSFPYVTFPVLGLDLGRFISDRLRFNFQLVSCLQRCFPPPEFRKSSASSSTNSNCPLEFFIPILLQTESIH